MGTVLHKGQVPCTRYKESLEIQEYSSAVIRGEFTVSLEAGKCACGRWRGT